MSTQTRFRPVLPGLLLLVGIALLVPSDPLLAQDADFIAVVKIQNYRQVSPNIVTLAEEDFDQADDAPFTFNAFAEASGMNLLTSGDVDPPAGPINLPMMPLFGDTELVYSEGFELFAEMNESFPDGSYTVDLVGLNDGMKSATVNLSGGTYTGVTKFTMFGAAQNIDASAAFNFQWDAIPGGSATDFVFLSIEDEFGNFVFETPDVGESGALDGFSTSVMIPGGTLSAGMLYEVTLEMFIPVDINESYGTGVTSVAAYGKTLLMPIRTMGGMDLSAPSLVQSAPSNFQSEVELNSIVTFAFDEPMDTLVDPGEAIDWTGVPNAALFDYSWSPDGRILFCDYAPGLPASATVQWTLNAPGSIAKLQDAAGNDLPQNGPGQFDTSATSNLGVSDVRSLDIIKGRAFFQDGPIPVDLESWFAEFFVDLNGISTVSSIDLGIPGVGTETNVAEFEFNFNGLEGFADFGEKADLDRIFPNGSYTLTMHTFHDGDKSVTLNVAPDSYPNPPTIQNFATTQAVDSTQPFTLQWAAMAGGTASDYIELVVDGESACFFETSELGSPGALNGTDTSVTIPANTLPPGRTLECELLFVKVIDNDTAQYPGARAVSGFLTITEFDIQTTGVPFQPELEIFYNGFQAEVTIIGERGRQYELRASDDLQNWFPLFTLFLFGNCEGDFRSSFEYFEDVITFPERFYQVQEVFPTP